METSNLDGEKNLKPRYAVHETFCSIGVIEDVVNEDQDEDKVILGECKLELCFNCYVEEPSAS